MDYNYHIRTGDYRIGITIEDDLVTFVRVFHRKEIYCFFRIEPVRSMKEYDLAQLLAGIIPKNLHAEVDYDEVLIAGDRPSAALANQVTFYK